MNGNKLFIVILSLSALFILSLTLLSSEFNPAKRNVRSVSYSSCTPLAFSEILSSEKYYVYEGARGEIPSVGLAQADYDPAKVLGAALGLYNEERWIEVDLSDQKLYAWEGDRLYLETPISTGLPGTPTPMGEFRIWIKLRATKMEGGEGSYYYYLPNVPYVMFFENENIPGWRGYGLHGTYWHNDFGRRRSHGCVNLPTSVAEQIYYWVSPVLPDGKSSIKASQANQGTRILIHE
jgi:lipoprotein-anchoring transpeptidase ErfK/SrfK